MPIHLIWQDNKQTPIFCPCQYYYVQWFTTQVTVAYQHLCLDGHSKVSYQIAFLNLSSQITPPSHTDETKIMLLNYVKKTHYYAVVVAVMTTK